MADQTPAPSIVADVQSTMLDNVFYNGETQELTVEFRKGGSSYTYSGVEPEVAQALVTAPSKGKYMHAAVLGKYAYRRNG